jgi:hypothetical protein
MSGKERKASDIAGAPYRESQKPSQFCNANICAFCGEKFIMGITVWRMQEGWVHPKCAEERGRSLTGELKAIMEGK